MKDILLPFREIAAQNETFARNLGSYSHYLKTKDGQFLKDVFLVLKGTILQEMLSSKFMDLPPDERDSIHRSYYHFNKLLDFLVEPAKWMRFKARWEQTIKSTKSRGKVTPIPERK